VRRLDSNWDPVFGQGVQSYLTDIDAVAQIIRSRLQLYLGEWHEDIKQGVPMWEKILGTSGKNKNIIDKIIQQRVAGSPNVKGVVTMTSSIVNRVYQCSITVQTDFGTIVVSNYQGK
jgi:hypothetical protein